MHYKGHFIDCYSNTYNTAINGIKYGFLTLQWCCDFIDDYMFKKYGE